MADLEKDKQRLKEINAELEKRTRRTKKYIDLEKEAEVLKARQIAQQKQLNREFQLGAKAQRQSTAFAEKEKKLIDEQEKSFASRISNLVKGNFLQAAGLDKTKDAREAEVSLAKEASSLSKDILTTVGLEADQRVGLQDLTKDIVDGAVSESGEVEARIDALGVEKNVKGQLLGNAQKLFDSSSATSKATKASAARAAKFSKAIGVGGAAFAILYQIAQQFAAQIDAIGKSFGSLVESGQDFNKTILRSSVDVTKLGAGIDDVISITAILSSNFGIALDTAAGLSTKIVDTAKATGLSTDEATNLFGVLMQTSNLSAEQAEKLGEGAFQLARANQVNPAQVLKDIAGSSETIALFTKDGAGNIAEAAVQARRFGISLDTSAKIAEGLLDFENSIAKEVEASVLLGRQLNLQKAREAALSGDIAGATQEVVKQLGSEAEFNKLNLIQRKALADSIGISVADMSKLVGETAKAGVQAKSFRDLLGEEGISQFTKVMNELKAVTAEITLALGPGLMGIARLLKGVMDFLKPVINVVNGVFNLISALVSLLNKIPGFGGGGEGSLSKSFLDFTEGLTTVNDFRGGRGSITTLAGPAGVFRLNPMDSVMATTNPIPVNDFKSGPAGSMGGTSNVNVSVDGKISGRDIVFFQESGAEFGDAPGNGLM